MTLSKSARYALYAAAEMAAADGNLVTVAQVAARYRIPATALAKVVGQLVRSGIALGTRGVGGGYRLARPASRTTVLDVLAAFEPPRPPGRCLLDDHDQGQCVQSAHCSLRSLFDEIDEQVRCTLASVSLETLVRRGRRDAQAEALVALGGGAPAA